MKMNKISIVVVGLVLSALALGLGSCKPEAPYKTKDVTIKFEVETLSAGFCEVKMGTYDKRGKRVRDAYYYAVMIEAREGVNLDKDYKNVCDILLDSVYMEYIQWRHGVLMSLTPFVADFASHSLYYDQTEEVFTFLKPDTDYWLLGFVVDPERNQPVGKLFWQTVHTKAKSTISVNFDIRVSGYWTYYYPNDSATGITLNNFPYLACTMDSLDLIKRLGDTLGMNKPAFFFLDSMKRVTASYDYKNTPVLYGISVFNNVDDDTEVEFLPGHTYYTAIAGFDGDFNQNHRNLVKFRWEGESSKYLLRQSDGIGFYW